MSYEYDTKQKQEILPPLAQSYGQLAPVEKPKHTEITEPIPGIYTGGYINSALSAWQDRYSTRAIDALSARNVAEAACIDNQAKVVRSSERLKEALHSLQTLPERLGNELALKRAHWAEQLLEARHVGEMNMMRREKEKTQGKAELTFVKAMLVDAEQQLQAQQDNGYMTHALKHKQKQIEFLNLELSEKERRALLDAKATDVFGTTEPADGVVMEALVAYRDRLNADGLDASKIEAEINRRKK